jgi:proline iminopeptidase
MKAAPIVVLHGGPSLPSDYLYPLADVIPYRSIVYYDQLGCGRSDEPTPNDPSLYSIDSAIDDLQVLLKKLGIRRFHLYGQSFGGILAYEYLKRLSVMSTSMSNQTEAAAATSSTDSAVECLSVVLSSAPTNVAQVEEQFEKLVGELLLESKSKNNKKNDNNDDNNVDIETKFRLEHQCRVDPMPKPLQDAYERAGSTWRGTTAIADYKATPVVVVPNNSSKEASTFKRMPSALILRGEYDFVSDDCVQYWKECWNHKFVRYKVLPGCSHHGLLEQPTMYGEILESFFSEYD